MVTSLTNKNLHLSLEKTEHEIKKNWLINSKQPVASMLIFKAKYIFLEKKDNMRYITLPVYQDSKLIFVSSRA